MQGILYLGLYSIYSIKDGNRGMALLLDDRQLFDGLHDFSNLKSGVRMK